MIFNLAKEQKYEGLKELNVVGGDSGPQTHVN